MATTRETLIQRRLLNWFRRNKRPLPWRRNRSPYRVWLSEIMLQQTQVATVIPYYERFLRRFPTVQSLANDPLQNVLALWSGLGYYSRARNLHRAAQLIVNQYGGKFPQNIDELRKIPGIGRYTAGAIASIAFGRPEAVVDGNVTRVLSRLFDIKNDVATPAGRAQIWALAENLLPKTRCGDHNEALMELGAVVCLPGDVARCRQCPLKTQCAARQRRTTASQPVNGKSLRVRSETHVIIALYRKGRWLCRRRPAKGLWAGLWELPTTVLNGGPPRHEAAVFARQFVRGHIQMNPTPFCRFERRLTHRQIEFVGFIGQINNRISPRQGTVTAKWKTLTEIERLGISTAVRDSIAALREHRAG